MPDISDLELVDTMRNAHEITAHTQRLALVFRTTR
jgi:hypothetical protein